MWDESDDALASQVIGIRREQYKCSHFRILVIGRANAGKTTILEKVCGVAKGTEPIIIYDKMGRVLVPDETHVASSIGRGIHDIEHQITYGGSNFIFHDSQGFESGAKEELEVVWDFIEKRSTAAKLKNQLHAIWYCIPMDSSRPILPTELDFFSKGTGKVPLVVIFTKFDGQVIQESGKLNDIEDDAVKWDMAMENAEITFQTVYLPKVFNTTYPPKAHVRLEDMDIPENDCPELTKITADAIDDESLQELFVSTQMNNLGLCVKYGLKHILSRKNTSWEVVFGIVISKFPHYWIVRGDNEIDWFERADKTAGEERNLFEKRKNYNDNDYGFFLDRGGIDPEKRDKRQQFFKKDILSVLLPLFGNKSSTFSTTPTECQVLVAINIIAKLSFWIMEPMETFATLAEIEQAFQQSIVDALDEFISEEYAKKLKTSITSEFLPSGHQDLLVFLYDQTDKI